MQIIDNKALEFVTKKHEQIRALIPRSTVLETRGEYARMLVAWGVDEVRILKNMRIKNVPHPILGQYSWPGMYTPFDHQRTSAEFMASHPRCFNLSEAGTGKTSAAAWAADYLMSRKIIRRVLIICPVSIMDTAWRSDLFKTCMHRTVGIASGSRTQRQSIIRGPYEFVIINFDGVKVVADELKAGGFDLLIIDEGNAIKNPQTARWKSVASLVTPSTWVWLMTGTPAAQSPVDAYGLAKLVNPSAVPAFLGRWRDQVMNKVTQFKWVPRADAQEKVFSALQPAIRFTKAECLDLPPLLYTTRAVSLTAQQRKYYDLVKRDMAAQLAGVEVTATNAASLINKLLQISQGVVYTDERDVVEFDITERLQALEDVLEATSNKVIVFVPFRHSLLRLRESLTKQGHIVDVIHGGVKGGTRADVIKAFQTADDPRVLLMIPQAAAHGITLTRADTIVWWGPTPSAELYLQGNARAHRAGQKNAVTVVRLQASPVEKRIYDLLDNRLDAHQLLVQLFQEELDLPDLQQQAITDAVAIFNTEG